MVMNKYPDFYGTVQKYGWKNSVEE